MTNRKRVDFNLYLITDRKIVTKTDDSSLVTGHLLEAVEDALKAGVKAIQLREKDLATRELLDVARRMRELTLRYGAKLFINDRVDIALCVHADGVHLGQHSIPPSAAGRVAGKGMLIGVSTHGLEEADIAEKEGADFITLGPLFPTPSKLRYGAPVGTAAFKRIKEKISLPVFGIGGIKRENVKEVMSAGAYGVALISGILGEGNRKAAAENYLKLLGEQL